jgi:hypothetical protein
VVGEQELSLKALPVLEEMVVQGAVALQMV